MLFLYNFQINICNTMSQANYTSKGTSDDAISHDQFCETVHLHSAMIAPEQENTDKITAFVSVRVEIKNK